MEEKLMKSLSCNQFEMLVYIEAHQKEKHTQRNLGKAIGVSLGIANKTLTELLDEQYLEVIGASTYRVSDKGYQVLEPHRVKKAIFIAAGFGSRMVPITLNTPKPLVLVHGKRIIETLLDAVIATGIQDITIVRGYLGEQFDVLLHKYPMIKFIENPKYNEANNISSAYLVRSEFANAYVFESDLLLYNPKIIRKYEYVSNYCGIPVEMSDDWCFTTQRGKIIDMQIGGRNCYQMVGISYWTKKDALTLASDLEKVFHMPGGKEKYWDEVALSVCKNHYDVYVKPIGTKDIVEIDTFSELKEIDPIYHV